MKTSLRLCMLSLAMAVPVGQVFAADTYPDHAIRLMVTTPPGGAADVIARNVGIGLSKALKVPVVIENRAGASGTIAANAVAKAPPDGYTILQNSITTHGIGPHVLGKLPYDTWKDLDPITLLVTMPTIMTVNADLPVRSVPDLIKLAKSKPGDLSFASSGSGGGPHLAGELFAYATGVKIVHIPYKGSGPAAIDVASGQAQIMFDAPPSLLPYIQSKKLRALAVLGDQRSALFPDLPTFAELGYKSVDTTIWYGLMAPAGTPTAIIDKLNAAARTALASPEVAEPLRRVGMVMQPDSPQEYRKFMLDDNQRWGEIIKNANIKFE